MKSLHVGLLALLLAMAGLGIAAWKHLHFGLPLAPAAEAEIWTVEARVRLRADGGVPMRVEMRIPGPQPHFHVLQEDFVSASFGAVTDDQASPRQAIWTARRPPSEPTLYYRLQLAERRSDELLPSPMPEYPEVPEYEEPMASAVSSLLEEVREASADIESFARQLVVRYSRPEADDRVRLLRGETDSAAERIAQMRHILAGARIPTRKIWLLPLSDGLREGRLEPWLQVHNERRWITVDPESGAAGMPEDYLLWTVGDADHLAVEGGERVSTAFSAARNQRDVVELAIQRAESGGGLMGLSLFSLPVQTQNVYRLVLLLPIGALVVVVMRNMVGVQTFGTFMPVLIAFAFRETRLGLGIVLFSGTVAIALLLRFYLERLRLLVVPRLAAVLTVVVLVMALISVFSHQLGVDRALSVALFPMVILAMTVERMSVVWEESGAGDALRQGVGSLLVAVLAYWVMTRPLLQHVMFVFPELLLVVLAMALLMGRYTGYRLTELWRFRSIWLSGGGRS